MSPTMDHGNNSPNEISQPVINFPFHLLTIQSFTAFLASVELIHHFTFAAHFHGRNQVRFHSSPPPPPYLGGFRCFAPKTGEIQASCVA